MTERSFFQKMIELHLTKTTNIADAKEYFTDISFAHELMGWLIKTLISLENACVNGYMVLYDMPRFRVSILILVEGDDEKKIREILDHPDEPYAEKYVANKVVTEPDPVILKQEDEETTQTEPCDTPDESEERTVETIMDDM